MDRDEYMEKIAVAMVAVTTMLDAAATLPASDKRAIAVARTQFDTGFLWAAKAVEGGGLLDG